MQVLSSLNWQFRDVIHPTPSLLKYICSLDDVCAFSTPKQSADVVVGDKPAETKGASFLPREREVERGFCSER